MPITPRFQFDEDGKIKDNGKPDYSKIENPKPTVDKFEQDKIENRSEVQELFKDLQSESTPDPVSRKNEDVSQKTKYKK